MKTQTRKQAATAAHVIGMSALMTSCLSAAVALPRMRANHSVILKQAQPIQHDVKLSTAMTAQQFEDWIVLTCGKLSDSGKPPLLPWKELLARLNAGQYVTDTAIVAVISASESSAVPLKRTGTAAAGASVDTLHMIDTVIGLIPGRVGLIAELHRRKAELYSNANDAVNAVREYADAERLLTPLHVAIDLQRIDTLVQEAGELTEQGKIQQAEPLYLEALSYEWYKVADSDSQHLLKDLYLRAGRGLIYCRRGNLAALKEIYFVPSTDDDLGPDLQQAIKDAEPPETPATQLPK